MTPTTYGRDFAYCLKSHGGVRGFNASLWRFLLRCTLFCHSVATFLTSVSSYEGGCGFEEDIVFSIITIESDTTMGDILMYEQIVYSALTAIYIIIMDVVQGDENGDSGLPIMLVIATYFGARFLPLSMGSVILYSVLNIVAIIWGACELKKD